MNETSLAALAASITEELVILVPSRGRPHNIVELIAAWRETHAGAAALVVIVDNDDPEVERYLEAWRHYDDITAHLIVSASEERLRLGGTLNAFAPVFAVDRLGVGFMGDDHRPRTGAWDLHLRDALTGRPGLVRRWR